MNMYPVVHMRLLCSRRRAVVGHTQQISSGTHWLSRWTARELSAAGGKASIKSLSLQERGWAILNAALSLQAFSTLAFCVCGPGSGIDGGASRESMWWSRDGSGWRCALLSGKLSDVLEGFETK